MKSYTYNGSILKREALIRKVRWESLARFREHPHAGQDYHGSLFMADSVGLLETSTSALRPSGPFSIPS